MAMRDGGGSGNSQEVVDETEVTISSSSTVTRTPGRSSTRDSNSLRSVRPTAD